MVVHELTQAFRTVYMVHGLKDQIPCQWFDGDKFAVNPFPVSSLKLIKAYEAPEAPVTFAEGDLVRHTSGGPDMLVQPMTQVFKMAFTANGMKDYIPCQWRNGSKFKSEGFHSAALEHIQEA